MIDATACRFCGEPTMGLFELDAGCSCFPDDRVQALCLQHVVGMEPLGSFEQIAEWIEDDDRDPALARG